MALTTLQRAICRTIAANRKSQGEAYVAGAVALNELLAAPRVSRAGSIHGVLPQFPHVDNAA